MLWQLQEAKQKFSELVERAMREGPQEVTRRGERTVVMVSAAEYDRLTGRTGTFKDLLLGPPYVTDDLDIRRDETPIRETELE